MVWFPWSSNKDGRGASVLRDAMCRLRAIRTKCGYDENGEANGEGPTKSGDPFRDKILDFTSQAKTAQELIDERNQNEAKRLGTQADMARDTHDVRMHLLSMKHDLQAIKVDVDKADRDLAKANRKKKKPEKIAAYEKVLKERQAAYESCARLFDELEDVNRQRHMTEKEIKEQKERNGGKRKGVQRAADRLHYESLQSRLKRGSKRGVEDGGGDDDEEPDNRTLESEHKEEMAAIKKKEDQMAAGLTRIGKTVANIENIALQIGAELDEQTAQIKAQEIKADTATKDIKQINKALTKLMKDTSPMNVIINVCCVVVLIALVGYFLNEFGVV